MGDRSWLIDYTVDSWVDSLEAQPERHLAFFLAICAGAVQFKSEFAPTTRKIKPVSVPPGGYLDNNIDLEKIVIPFFADSPMDGHYRARVEFYQNSQDGEYADFDILFYDEDSIEFIPAYGTRF